MNSPRSLRSPRKGVNAAPRITFNLLKIDVPDMIPKQIRKPKSIQELIKLSTEILELNRPAKRALDENGNLITSLSNLPNGAKIYISCCDDPKEEKEEPLYKSRLPINYRKDMKVLPSIRQPKKKPLPENAIQHQAIAASQGTVKENLRDALLAMYSSLNDNQRSKLLAAPALSKLLSETRQFEIEDEMMSAFIGPSSILDGTTEYEMARTKMIEELKGLKVEDCQFCFIGPPQSGKSTLLYLCASLFFEKLEIVGLGGDYLAVAINWLQQDIFLDDIHKIYDLFVEKTMIGLRRVRKDLIPIIPVLESWLKSMITIPARAPIPPQAAHLNGFPTVAFTKVGEEIWRSWNGHDTLSSFLTHTVSLPANIASVMGLKGAVLIYDHMEAASISISDKNDHFSNAKPEPAILSAVIEESLSYGPCFVSSKDDKQFFRIYNVDNLKQVTTERIIAPEENALEILDPLLLISEEICHGCPGYVAKFRNLYKMVQEMAEKAAIKSQFSKIKSVIDISRREMIRHELTSLCLLLSIDNDDVLDGDKMNQLMEKIDINIHVH